MKRILVPTDFSAHAERIKVAAQIARAILKYFFSICWKFQLK
jgi:hypothetical protein